MRRCIVFGVVALGAFFFTLPSQASAQSAWIGAGATIPSGDFGDYANTGPMGVAGISLPLGEKAWSLFAEGFYGANNHSDFDGDKTTLYGGHGGLTLDFAGEGEAGFYVFGQVGFMIHDFASDDFPEDNVSDTGLAFGGGAGYGFPLASLNGWLEARYMQGQFDEENTALFGLMAGISFPLGGNGG